MPSDRFAELVRLPSRLEAQLLVSQLGSQGIAAWVFDTALELSEIPSLIAGVRVMVTEDDLAEAREMVEELLGT
jgi:hypothetical protein